jgi:hypothetical protein
MPYAKLASLPTLLLIRLWQAGEDLSTPAKLVVYVSVSICLFFLSSVAFLLTAAASVAFLTLFFGALAAPPVVVIRWLYRKAVLRWMSKPGGDGRAARETPLIAQTQTNARSNLRFEIHDPDTSRIHDECPLNRRAEEASRAVTRVYLKAAVVYAVVMTPLVASGSFALKDKGLQLDSFGSVSFYLSAFAVLLWLPVLMYLVVAVARPWRKLVALAAYSFLLSTPWFFLPHAGAKSIWLLLTAVWLLLMSAPTSTMFVLRFSGVGGLALGMILSLSALAFSLAFKVTAIAAGSLTQPNAAGNVESIGVGDVAFLVSFALILVGPFVAALFALGLLWWMSHRYARKKTSEQILLLDIFWLVTTFMVSLMSYLMGAGWYALLGPTSFAIYKLVVWRGLRRLERERERLAARELRLLLLRVFGAKRRSEWLLKRLGHYWRYAGSIQLIAAPDLAGVNLELDELLGFLTGRLKRRFIKDARDGARRVESLDSLPDPDGRYRVNEFFCHADVWGETVAELTRRSDAVLMDLRGFTSKNQGCVYELFHLVNAVPVNQLVIVVNEQTDVDFLRHTFESAWAAMDARSPNRDLPSPALRLLQIRRQNSRAVRRLLSMLREAAEGAKARTHVAAVRNELRTRSQPALS